MNVHVIEISDEEAWILAVRARVALGASLEEAASITKRNAPELAARVLDRIGSWPSSYLELRALQELP